MKNSSIIQRSKRFFKNDIFTVIVAMSIVLLVAGVPITAFAAEAMPQTQAQAEQALSKININTAEAAALAEALKGIGLKKAQAIVAWREKFGKFVRVEQLTEVKGIGEKTLQSNAAVLAL